MGVEIQALRISQAQVLTILERHGRDASKRAGAAAVELAQDRAPVAKVHRTGQGRRKHLRDAIRATTRSVPDGVMTTVRPNPKDAFYGGFVEGGTTHDDGSVRTAAVPFMGPARDLNDGPAERIIQDGAVDARDEIARLL